MHSRTEVCRTHEWISEEDWTVPRDAYSDRVAARVYSDNMEMARFCNRNNLQAVSEAIAWLETQAATHSDAGVLLDELRPIKHHLTCQAMMGPPKESGDPLKLDSLATAKATAKTDVWGQDGEQLRDLIAGIEHRNQRELTLIQAAAQVIVSACELQVKVEEAFDTDFIATARKFLIAKWEEQLKDDATTESD